MFWRVVLKRMCPFGLLFLVTDAFLAHVLVVRIFRNSSPMLNTIHVIPRRTPRASGNETNTSFNQMGYSENSSKGALHGDYIGDDYRGY